MADSFTNVFGGSPVQPSEVRYRAIDLTADVHLFWPSQSVDTNDVIARWNDVTAESANLNIIFPSATTIGPGEDAVFANKGSNSFNVLAVDLTTIASVAPGVAMYIINSSNTTDAGAWQLTIFGGTASQVNAAALAGDGLKAFNAQLQVNFPIIPVGSNYVSTFTDLANVLNWTGGAGTITLESAAVAAQGWFCEIRNSGSGSVVVSPPSGLIDGAASKTYAQTESSLVHTDGINYYTVGYGRAVTSSFTRLVVSVAGNTNVTLTSAQAQNQMLEFTGALTGDITVFVPANVAEYFVYNHTTGAHTLTFSATGGTGAIVIQGQRRIAVCDGTNINFADTLGTGTVTQVNSGTGLTGGPITATGTLAIASTGVSPGSYTLLAATVNAQGQLTAASSGSLDIIGNVQGDILYRNATVWTVLAPGTSGQLLTTAGAGANPAWANPFNSNVRLFGPGTTTYTPTAGTRTVDFICIGAGGAGGGANATAAGQISCGSGAWAGEIRYVYNVAVGSVSGGAITVGAGGVGAAGGSGGSGGNTTFNGVIASGGGGGGAGTSLSSASFAFAGIANQSAGTGGSLATATFPPYLGLYLGSGGTASGFGGSNPYGAGGASITGTGAGSPAQGHGSGGSGAGNGASQSARAGGNGGPGLLIVIEHS